jgi:hypothetical protein
MANSITNILTSLKSGVEAINNLVQAINKVTSTSSTGTVIIRVTQLSS